MTTLYVAGPMTGRLQWNFPAFNAAQERLTARGFTVLNPARHGPADDSPDMTWADYMRRDIPDVIAADGLALLHEWWTSRGASLEVTIASTLGMPCRPEADWGNYQSSPFYATARWEQSVSDATTKFGEFGVKGGMVGLWDDQHRTIPTDLDGVIIDPEDRARILAERAKLGLA